MRDGFDGLGGFLLPLLEVEVEIEADSVEIASGAIERIHSRRVVSASRP